MLKTIGEHHVFFLTIIISLFQLAVSPAGAELDFGFKAHCGNDFAAALDELRPLAEGGDPRAQLWLGLMYYYGRNVTFNEPEAYRWIHKSANQLYFNAEFTVCFPRGCFIGGAPPN
ncbi:MAG: hypothetical protein CFH36_00910 [Alphaproteobacteria bacterium MarineAlpha9_Bin6]|nr:MAG: hypothetical protein CFH36_00910 [Alphaproteobacteria bacterium MarineAlpha9_Bin6]